MSKKANPVLIGIFVIGACIMLMGAIVMFGAGRYFEKRSNYILYFEGSVKGLKVGAPVTFRGVQIGEVTEIKILVNQLEHSMNVPVVVDFKKGSIENQGDAPFEEDIFVEQLIQHGMRAQLQMQSLLTGLLVINLDFFPDTPIRLVGKNSKYKEVPTVPSTLEELSKTIESLPITSIVEDVRTMVNNINNILTDDGTGQTVDELKITLSNASKLLKHADQVMQKVDGKIAPLLDTFKSAGDSIGKTSENAVTALKSFDDTFSKDSEIRYEAGELLKELRLTLKSLRDLSDYLERNPNALITGKKETEQK